MKKKILLMAIGISSGVAVAQNPFTNIDSALIACYSFNGNALDGSGNGNHGTVNGATPVNDRFGNSNSAYMFNGSSNNIVIPAFNTKINPNEFSISFWATSNLYATRSPFLLVPDDPNNRFNVHIYYGNQISNSQTFFDWGNINNSGRLYIGGSPLPASGSWDHWVFTTSAINGNMNCYKNGALQYTKTGTDTLLTSGTARNLLIGGGVGIGSSYLWFEGTLDDIKIYGRALTQNDVTFLYYQTISCRTVPTGYDHQSANSVSMISVHPNPSNTGIYTISGINVASEITLRSLAGEIIKTTHISSSGIQLDIKEYEPGVYFLSIKNSTGIYTQKLIRE